MASVKRLVTDALRQLLRTSRNVVCVAVLAGLAGCGLPPPEATLLDPAVFKPSGQKQERGLVWMFPGLVGVPWELGPAYRGLRDAGLTKQVQFYQWEIMAPDFFAHLTRYEANCAEAREVADRIAEYARRYPGRPIDLVGYSAGGFMALLVAEALPPDVRLNNVVLAQPAVSPSYDLTAALRPIDGKLVNFYSPHDWALSGVFCWLFGTMDRRYVATAGMRGFALEAMALDEEQTAKIEQVPWSPVMAEYGHPGNHAAILQYRWNKYFVSPYVVDAEDLRIDPPLAGAATGE